MIQSPYTIRLKPAGTETQLVLVAAGGWLENLPTFEAAQVVFETDGVSLNHAFFRPLGGVTVTINFAVEHDHGDLAAALDAFLDAELIDETSLLEIDGELSFLPEGGGDATIFAEAAVRVITPELPDTATATTLRVYQILTTLPQ
jgi:hypothetical protein